MTDNRKQIDILQVEIDRNQVLISQNREKRDKLSSDRDVKKLEDEKKAQEDKITQIESSNAAFYNQIKA